MARHDNKELNVDVATWASNFAMLMYSLVAVIAGSLLPQLTTHDEHLFGANEEEDEEAELARILCMVTKCATDTDMLTCQWDGQDRLVRNLVL